MNRRDLLLATTALVSGCAGSSRYRSPSLGVTVPLHVEGDRPFVELTFARGSGRRTTARFLIDTGGGGFLLTERLAREIGASFGEVSVEDGQRFAQLAALPKVAIGGFDLALNPHRVSAVLDSTSLLSVNAPGYADGMLPGHVLAQYHVIFDYPTRQFTLALPRQSASGVNPIAMPVEKRSGFPFVQLHVDGVAHGMLLDTGASFTMVSEALLKRWGAQHPEWPRHNGAVAGARTLGGQTLETMFLPRARFGSHEMAEVGVTSQPEGTFERFISSMTAKPVVGALAGNVLNAFRIELDFANERLYVSKP